MCGELVVTLGLVFVIWMEWTIKYIHLDNGQIKEVDQFFQSMFTSFWIVTMFFIVLEEQLWLAYLVDYLDDQIVL
jgi:hypothetical protein